MRIAAALLVVLTACSAASKPPAWPKRADRENDGGESLEPRVATSILALEKTPEPAEKAAAAARAEKAAERTSTWDAAVQGVGSISSPDPNDPFMTDEIVIEVNDAD